MSLAVYPNQSNSREGPFQIKAGVDLTGKESFLVKSAHTAGAGEMRLPTALTDIPDYLVLEGAAAGKQATVVALHRGFNCRVRLSGTCNPGDELTQGAINGTDNGKVRTVPATTGSYTVLLKAEQKGVDGQLVLCRAALVPRVVVVP